MCQLLETVRLENGKLFNLNYHERRLNKARETLFQCSDPIELTDHIIIPERCNWGLFKSRILYSEKIEEVTFEPYRIRSVDTLQVVYDDTIEYSFKYAERAALEALFRKKESSDDILIVKNGLVTDTSYSNIAFYENKTWYTPHKPLLRGTMRESLIEKGLIHERKITEKDLFSFQYFKLMNAMIGFDSSEVSMENIILS